MKIALLGYGKMGQEIEKLAIKKGHEIFLIIDSIENWEKDGVLLAQADIAIDFTTPTSIVDNIYRCFEAGIPIVTGTTGWLDDLDKVRQDCLDRKKTLFFSPNFSVGVNLFFELNRCLADIMSKWSDYEISIEETHTIHKQDAPSGTAIVLANDIIRYSEKKDKWVKETVENPEELGIKSYRTDNVPGTHLVRYESVEDTIEIVHTAKSRRGFAMGALLAAEWVYGKTGFFEMKDLLSSQILINPK
ncbi:MAG: 4-hydroxy-tetrahydrodipicolinate reductase [Bacteroidales bacterium]|jgi:4-hydroxy-tetrahydrodipicolinate reductase|nr:4-hydroxy-tetrahydrodipicolinate reductase [Bacteroidales bacterium]